MLWQLNYSFFFLWSHSLGNKWGTYPHIQQLGKKFISFKIMLSTRLWISTLLKTSYQKDSIRIELIIGFITIVWNRRTNKQENIKNIKLKPINELLKATVFWYSLSKTIYALLNTGYKTLNLSVRKENGKGRMIRISFIVYHRVMVIHWC